MISYKRLNYKPIPIRCNTSIRSTSKLLLSIYVLELKTVPNVILCPAYCSDFRYHVGHVFSLQNI